MSLELTYDETTVLFRTDLSTWLASIGKLISDKTDAIFMLKDVQTNADVDADYQTNEGANLYFTANVVTFSIGDFSGLTPGCEYNINLGIKFTGDTIFREVPLSPDFKILNVIQDGIRG